MLTNSKFPNKSQSVFSEHFERKNIWVVFHEELDHIFFVAKDLQELFAQLQLGSSLTYLSICHHDCPTQKNNGGKKKPQQSNFSKLLYFSSALSAPTLSVPDKSKDLYILPAAAQHILTYNVLLRVLV